MKSKDVAVRNTCFLFEPGLVFYLCLAPYNRMGEIDMKLISYMCIFA